MKFSFDGDDINYMAEDWFKILVANQDELKKLDAEDIGFVIIRSRVQLLVPAPFSKCLNHQGCNLLDQHEQHHSIYTIFLKSERARKNKELRLGTFAFLPQSHSL